MTTNPIVAIVATDPEPRRRVLATLALLPALVYGVWSRLARAARPAAAFAASDLDEAIKAMYGDQRLQADPRVAIAIANFVDNGAIVPIEVAITSPEVRAVTLLAADNPVPLLCRFEFGEGTLAFIATRIKLAKSTRVVAIAETGAGLLFAEHDVGVGKGGCQ